MSVFKIGQCDSVAEIGKLLHWVIDDPTISTYDKSTGLRTAEKRIQRLIEQGKPVNEKDSQGHTILDWLLVTKTWSTEIEEFIQHLVLDLGIDINQRDRRNFTPLMWAVIFDRAHVVPLLLSLGADPNLEQSEGKNCFYFAEECDNLASLSALKDLS